MSNQCINTNLLHVFWRMPQRLAAVVVAVRALRYGQFTNIFYILLVTLRHSLFLV
jgi:hypothetical protein